MPNIINTRPWTSQPQYKTIVNGGIGWSAGDGLVPTTLSKFGRKSNPASLTSVDTVPSFVTGKTFTVVAIYACPLASQSAGQLRIGGTSDGIRLNCATSSGGLNPVAWTANGVTSLLSDIVSVSGFDDTPLVSIASCGPSDIKTWFGASGAGSSNFSGIYSHDNVVAMNAPSNLNIQITGPAMDWYGVIVIPWRVSDAYAIELIRNPWQLFAPLRSRLFVPPPTSSGLYTLTAQSGSYSLSGQNTNLLKTKLLAAQSGSYALAGQSAQLLKSKRLISSGGSYQTIGSDTSLYRSRQLSLSGGTYSITGASADIVFTGLAVNYVLTAQGGSYSLTGSSASITYTALSPSYLLVAQGGTYSLFGNSAEIKKSKRLVASGGTYSYAGQQVNITAGPAISSNLVRYINVLTGEILLLQPLIA